MPKADRAGRSSEAVRRRADQKLPYCCAGARPPTAAWGETFTITSRASPHGSTRRTRPCAVRRASRCVASFASRAGPSGQSSKTPRRRAWRCSPYTMRSASFSSRSACGRTSSLAPGSAISSRRSSTTNDRSPTESRLPSPETPSRRSKSSRRRWTMRSPPAWT